MTYTNAWTNILPLGSQQASTADDEFRKLRVDIFDRMNSIVEDWTADPVVLKASAVQAQQSAPTGPYGWIHGSAFQVGTLAGSNPWSGAQTVSVSSGGLSVNPASGTLVATLPILLATGTKIVGPTVWYRAGFSSATFKFGYLAINTGNPTTIVSITPSFTSGIASVTLVGPNNPYTVADNQAFFIEVTFTGSGVVTLLGTQIA